MASGWRIASGLLLVPVAVAGLAACGSSTSSAKATSATASASAPAPATASGSAAKAVAGTSGISAATLRKALLSKVNGISAASPASSGTYSSMTASTGKQAGQVSPASCAGTATAGFDPTVLAGAPAAAVTFQVGNNGVSEVLVAPSSKAAAAALGGQPGSKCSQFTETVKGKTYNYSVVEKNVSGIGQQARAVNVSASGSKKDQMWSLIYRANKFIGTVTVVGPNASQVAVTQLGKQAFEYANKSLA